MKKILLSLAAVLFLSSTLLASGESTYVRFAANTATTVLRDNTGLATTGVVILPEVRLGYNFTDRVGIYVSGAMWGLQLLDSGVNTSNQSRSRTDLNGNNNYIVVGIDFKVDRLLQIGVFTNNDFLLGIGYGNLEQAPGTGRFDNGLLVMAGLSLTIYDIYTYIR